MDRQQRWSRLFWPAMTAVLVSVPLIQFRAEGSAVHTVFRVAWLLLLVLSVLDIGRTVYQGLRGRRVPAPGPSTHPPDHP